VNLHNVRIIHSGSGVGFFGEAEVALTSGSLNMAQHLDDDGAFEPGVLGLTETGNGRWALMSLPDPFTRFLLQPRFQALLGLEYLH